MNKTLYQNIIFTITFIILNVTISFAQPEPCGPIPFMANTCLGACVVCDIDGYTGINDLQDGGQDLGFTFCSNADDMHFIAFIAGSTSLSIQIDVSNCSAGNLSFFSLDIGLYESFDCTNFDPITPCKQDIGNGESHVFNTDVPLTIGQYYYIVMDGSAGSICNWTFTVLEGTTQVDLLEESGDIIGEINPCLNTSAEFEVDFPIGATDFVWTMNDEDLNVNSNLINYLFDQDIPYELCVVSRNACDDAPPTCIQIDPKNVPETNVEDVFCESMCYQYNDTLICDPGTYTFVFQDTDGCDSTVNLILDGMGVSTNSLDIDICDGDVFFIGDTPFTTTGIYEETLQTIYGCDSIVTLDLLAVLCNIQSNFNVSPPVCNGDSNAEISLTVTNGTGPFVYIWVNLNTNANGAGNIAAANITETITGLPSGNYLIEINDGFGNVDIILADILDPPVLTLNLEVSDYNGSQISCFDAQDAFIQANVSGGEIAYNYQWSNMENTALIENLGVGDYTIIVTDDSGCEIQETVTILPTDTIKLEAVFNDVNCDGFSSGSIEILNIEGGFLPYSYILNGQENDGSLLFEGLTEGDYQLEVMDNNGCSVFLDSSLTAPEIPIVELGNEISLELGESAILYPFVNDISIENLMWFTADNISCDTCLNPTVMPMQSGYYVLQVTSQDDCQKSDSVFIEILDKRNVFIPNVFTPNFDGTNDFFTVFGEMPNVQEVEQLIVFDRWGGLVFEQSNFFPNDLSKGWDGSKNGTNLDNGVFVYMAKVRFWDNQVHVYKGDISLLR